MRREGQSDDALLSAFKENIAADDKPQGFIPAKLFATDGPNLR